MTAVEVAIVVGVMTVIWLRIGNKKTGKRLTDDVSAASEIRHESMQRKNDPAFVCFHHIKGEGSAGRTMAAAAIGREHSRRSSSVDHQIDYRPCLNLGSHNYLDLLGNPTIQEKAISSINKYGVGSCGSRGFYGTIGELVIRVALEYGASEVIGDRAK